MAEPYLANLQSIVGQMRVIGNEMNSIACKHFFSGAAAYIDGQIFMSLSPVGLALKLSDSDCASLFEQGATPLRYFPKAPLKRGYAVLSAQMVNDREVLNRWVARSVEFASGRAK